MDGEEKVKGDDDSVLPRLPPVNLKRAYERSDTAQIHCFLTSHLLPKRKMHKKKKDDDDELAFDMPVSLYML